MISYCYMNDRLKSNKGEFYKNNLLANTTNWSQTRKLQYEYRSNENNFGEMSRISRTKLITEKSVSR